MAHDELHTLLSVSKKLAAMILENGGETYRAEDAVSRLCGLCGTTEAAVLALPTAVLIQFTARDGKTHSTLCRFKSRKLDLGAVALANDVARRLAAGELSVYDALTQLSAAPSHMPVLLSAGVSAFSIGCFSILMGGSVFEFFVSAVCAFLSQLLSAYFKNEDMYYFITSLVCGAVCALTAVLAVSVFHTGRTDIIIGAAILPLLPGMTLISAIRDSVRGDLISGAARLGDVLVVSLALAFGVGAVLWVSSLAGGVPI